MMIVSPGPGSSYCAPSLDRVQKRNDSGMWARQNNGAAMAAAYVLPAGGTSNLRLRREAAARRGNQRSQPVSSGVNRTPTRSHANDTVQNPLDKPHPCRLPMLLTPPLPPIE